MCTVRVITCAQEGCDEKVKHDYRFKTTCDVAENGKTVIEMHGETHTLMGKCGPMQDGEKVKGDSADSSQYCKPHKDEKYGKDYEEPYDTYAWSK